MGDETISLMLTNQAGEIVREYDYDQFGSLIGSEGSTDTNYLFTGQEYDAESDLYFFNARYYNPVLGRFISRDSWLGTLGDTISRNTYAYAKNNPLKYNDPTGNNPQEAQAVQSVVMLMRDNKIAGLGWFDWSVGNITDDFVRRLKDSAWNMEWYINPIDWAITPKYFEYSEGYLKTFTECEGEDCRVDHRFSQMFLASELGISDKYINKLPAYVLDELESKPLKFKHFYENVRPGGIWDLKGNVYSKYKDSGVKINNIKYDYDVPGNILYGYAGAAGGFSIDTLKMMAGLAQISTNTSQPGWTWGKSYYDDPSDQSAIQAGYDLYQRFGRKIDSKRVDSLIYPLQAPIDSPPNDNFLLNNIA